MSWASQTEALQSRAGDRENATVQTSTLFFYHRDNKAATRRGQWAQKKKTTAKQVEAACNEATGPNISQPNVAVKL